jgi:uncharacterized membrane protein
MQQFLIRLFQNLILGPLQVRRIFPLTFREVLRKHIYNLEKQHSGELKVVVDPGLSLSELLSSVTPAQKAIDVFSMQRVWNTENNNGILLYILISEKKIEIIADKGIYKCSKVPERLNVICRKLEDAFKKCNYKIGVLECLEEISEVLRDHFPKGENDKNEVVDDVVILNH